MGRRNFLELDADGAPAPMPTRPAGTVAGWNALALRTMGTALPPHVLALLHTCMYNAWAAYDGDARQTTLGVAVRLPRAERDAASKAAAMSHAAHGVLAGLCPEARAGIDAHMRRLGLDPDAAAGPFSPAGIGRAQAAAMLDGYCLEQPFALMPAEVRQPIEAGEQALAAHWCRLARQISVHDGDGDDDDRDVLLFFVLANALADAALAGGDGTCAAAAAAEALRRVTGSNRLDGAAPTDAAGSERGRKIGARVFDKARRYWQGKL
jgi:hypothetical protein